MLSSWHPGGFQVPGRLAQPPGPRPLPQQQPQAPGPQPQLFSHTYYPWHQANLPTSVCWQLAPGATATTSAPAARSTTLPLASATLPSSAYPAQQPARSAQSSAPSAQLPALPLAPATLPTSPYPAQLHDFKGKNAFNRGLNCTNLASCLWSVYHG